MDDLHDLSFRQLIDLCLGPNGTEASWNDLAARIQAVIAPAIFNCLRRWSEVVQRTLLKLFANECKALRMVEHQHENSFRAFFRVVASRAAEDYRREQQAQPKQLGIRIG